MKNFPLSDERQRLVLDRACQFVDLASGLYSLSLVIPDIVFNLSGHCAGMYLVKHGRSILRFNPWVFNCYFEEHLYETVPHEVAHYVVDQLHKPRRRVKPHGVEWKKVMLDFGIEPQVTFRHDLKDVPVRRQQVLMYRCDCQDHEMTMTRHNRVRRGTIYLCTDCGSQLRRY